MLFGGSEPNNKKAIRAYEKNGFTIVASVVTEIGNRFVMDDYMDTSSRQESKSKAIDVYCAS